jgi:predicted sulfurtransferase
MNSRRRVTTLSLGLSLVLACAFALEGLAADAPRITKEEVREMLGNPGVIVIDVRTGGDWNASDVKIQGAVREDPRSVDSWMDKYPKDKTLIFYCA